MQALLNTIVPAKVDFCKLQTGVLNQSCFKTGAEVGPGLATVGVMVLKMQQTEASRTGLRVSSREKFYLIICKSFYF